VPRHREWDFIPQEGIFAWTRVAACAPDGRVASAGFGAGNSRERVTLTIPDTSAVDMVQPPRRCGTSER
jgi:hypothetical protein